MASKIHLGDVSEFLSQPAAGADMTSILPFAGRHIEDTVTAVDSVWTQAPTSTLSSELPGPQGSLTSDGRTVDGLEILTDATGRQFVNCPDSKLAIPSAVSEAAAPPTETTLPPWPGPEPSDDPRLLEQSGYIKLNWHGNGEYELRARGRGALLTGHVANLLPGIAGYQSPELPTTRPAAAPTEVVPVLANIAAPDADSLPVETFNSTAAAAPRSWAAESPELSEQLADNDKRLLARRVGKVALAVGYLLLAQKVYSVTSNGAPLFDITNPAHMFANPLSDAENFINFISSPLRALL